MLKADLHVHTRYSLDCDTKLEDVISRCQQIGINCVAIADHGTVEGALKLQKIAPFRVIVAEEILTPYGEIMGMFLKQTIKSGITAIEAIMRIRDQGGLVCIPHPFDIFRRSALNMRAVEEVIEHVDIFEVFNAKTPFQWNARKAQIIAEKYSLAKSAGSDAHAYRQIGNAYVEFPEYTDAGDFLQFLKQGKIDGHPTNPIFQMRSAWARLTNGFKHKANRNPDD